MSSNLLFDFSIDQENKTILIKREFDAKPELVWQAWTTAGLLDQWCAPNPYSTETKTLDLREGGCWHYTVLRNHKKGFSSHLKNLDKLLPTL